MLTVTDAACVHLVALLDDAEVPDGTAARCTFEDDQLSLVPDTPGDDDQTIDHDGRVVLIVGPMEMAALDDVTIDVAETEDGPQLVLT